MPTKENTQKVENSDLLDWEVLENLLVGNILARKGMPDPSSKQQLSQGLAHVDSTLEWLCPPKHELAKWVTDMLTAMRYDSRATKALLDAALRRSGDKIGGTIVAALSDDITGGLAFRLREYLERFHPINSLARGMTHRIYREHLEYVPVRFEGEKVYWEVYHNPTGLIVEDCGLDSEDEAVLFVEQFPTLDAMSEKGDSYAWR